MNIFAAMRPVFLIGYMGCGKTTLGRALSRKMGYEFIDLDIYIENRYRHSIKELFALHGEAGFRKIERKMLEEICEFERTVVACGGGTPCHFDNIALMNSKGTTVYLTTSAERIAARLSLPGAKAKRPIIAGKTDEELKQFIADNLKAREPYYSQASITFDSTDIETAAATEATAALLAGILAFSANKRGNHQ